MTKEEGIALAPERRVEACQATAQSVQLLVLGQLDKGLIAMEHAAAMVADEDCPPDARDQQRKMRSLQKRFDTLRKLMDEIALAVVDLGMTATAPPPALCNEDKRPKLRLVSCCDNLSDKRRAKAPALHVCARFDDQGRA